MSRMRLALTAGGVAIVAGTAGYVLGLLFAPASGREIRRRLTWRAEEQWRSMTHASGRMLERAAVRARQELRDRGVRLETLKT